MSVLYLLFWYSESLIYVSVLRSRKKMYFISESKREKTILDDDLFEVLCISQKEFNL